MSINPNVAYLATKARADYFITKPYDKDELVEILMEIRKEIKEDSIIIKIPSGDRRVRINNLNYINIVRRCLCYHLKDGTMLMAKLYEVLLRKLLTHCIRINHFYF